MVEKTEKNSISLILIIIETLGMFGTDVDGGKIKRKVHEIY